MRGERKAENGDPECAEDTGIPERFEKGVPRFAGEQIYRGREGFR